MKQSELGVHFHFNAVSKHFVGKAHNKRPGYPLEACPGLAVCLMKEHVSCPAAAHVWTALNRPQVSPHLVFVVGDYEGPRGSQCVTCGCLMSIALVHPCWGFTPPSRLGRKWFTSAFSFHAMEVWVLSAFAPDHDIGAVWSDEWYRLQDFTADVWLNPVSYDEIWDLLTDAIMWWCEVANHDANGYPRKCRIVRRAGKIIRQLRVTAWFIQNKKRFHVTHF